MRNFKVGERVVIPSTIGCGYCSYCRAGYYAQCDNANPNGREAGTAFFGGPAMSGPFDGCHVASQQVAYQGSRLDPLGVELRMKQEHERRPRHDAGPAEGERGVVRTGDGHVVLGLERPERKGRPEQVGEVAHRRVRPTNGVQVIAHACERRKLVVQPRRDDHHGMAALAEATDGLERVAVTAQILGQEQVAGEEDRLTHQQCAVQWLEGQDPEGRARRRPRSADRPAAAARRRGLEPARARRDGGGHWRTRSVRS